MRGQHSPATVSQDDLLFARLTEQDAAEVDGVNDR
jgi:hypothetical protein